MKSGGRRIAGRWSAPSAVARKGLISVPVARLRGTDRRGSIVDGRSTRPAYHAKGAARLEAKRAGRFRSMPYSRRALEFGGFCKWCSKPFAFGSVRWVRYSERGKLRQCCDECAEAKNYANVRKARAADASPESIVALAERMNAR